MEVRRTFSYLPDAERAMDLVAQSLLANGPTALLEVTGEPLWLYGRGNLGRMARECLRSVGVGVAGIFDRDSLDIAPLDAQVAVCVVADPYVQIEDDLACAGYGDIAPFYDLWEGIRGDHPLANGWVADLLLDEDHRKIESVWRRWDDDASRAHHLQFLAWRYLREEWTFDFPGSVPVRNDDRYFIPEVRAVLHDREVFLDGGAHDGRTSVTFKSMMRGYYRGIVAVEPDRENRQLMLEAMLPNSRHAVPGCALAAEDGFAPFCDGYGFASRLSPRGLRSIKTLRIDSLDVEPTFVKLHLEGGELGALCGGRETLRQFRPIVAATVYHDSDGLWRTADWLMGELDDYVFLFRNHCWCAAGAVVYAIPRERSTKRREKS